MHRTMTGLALAIGLAAASIVTASAQQYGYNNLPSGSYQQSCNNLRMNGSTLSASCTAANGQRVYSSLNVNGCRGDIGNNNGHLACNGNNGYNNNGYNNNDNDNDNGHHHHHHYNNGNGNAYGHYNNGNNGNNGYGYGGGLPGGSYQQSCTNTRMNGSTLYASCTAANGNMINSSINVNSCHGNDIANRNGYLRC